MSASSAVRRPRPVAPTARRPGLRVLPGGRSTAPKAPFVVLVLLILGIGLIGLLLLNTGLQHGSFEIRDLEREVRVLRDQHTALTQQTVRLSAPEELATRAAAAGMVPAEGVREHVVMERAESAVGEP